jgi:hypothetical protein
MKPIIPYLLFLVVIITLATGCEKEITVDLPPGRQSLVVEASINQLFTNLNYVYISKTLDYFNPNVSFNGIRNALVYITPGTINGNDTSYSLSERVRFYDIGTVPGIDTLLKGFTGIYTNPVFSPLVGIPYKLEVFAEGQSVTGVTTIPKIIEIDTLFYRQEINKYNGDTDMFVTFEFNDGPEQNNYRLFGRRGTDSVLIGWGASDFSREFDDELVNHGTRPYTFFRPFNYSDTLDLYLTSIGRKEYLFWTSYQEAANNGGPFATPAEAKSNIQGAIGSFTGYGVSYKRTVLR